MNKKAETVCGCSKEKAFDEEKCPDCLKSQKEERQLVESPGTQIASTAPVEVIKTAMAGGVDPDQLEKLLELQQKWEANEARKAFVRAMTNFKENPPNIYKDTKNEQFNSMYTSLNGLVNTAIPELSKHGFSHHWGYGTAANGNPSVTCILTHELGHSISVTQDAAPIQSKNKGGQVVTNPIQQVKCTQTYLKITTFEAVTGLVSKEVNLDDDGNARTTIDSIDDKQLHTLRDNLLDAEAKEEPLCKHFGIDELKDLPKNSYQRALVAIKEKKEKKEHEDIVDRRCVK